MFIPALWYVAFWIASTTVIFAVVMKILPEERRSHWALILLGLLYPLGELIQDLHFGPLFLRYHLSDFGFIPGYGIPLAIVFPRLSIRTSLFLSFCFALCFEGYQFSQGEGDSVDILAYIVSLLLSVWVSRR